MTKYSAVVYWISLLALLITSPFVTLVTRAEPPASPPADTESGKKEREYPDPVERFLKSAPPSILRKLKDPATAQKAATELNKYFGKSAINKRIVVHTKAEDVQPDNNGQGAARIRAESTPIKWEGGTMARLSWLYVPAFNAAKADDVKVGEEITVAGIVRRCEVVVTPEGLRFDFDLWKAKVEGR